jgi:hypothetical protein
MDSEQETSECEPVLVSHELKDEDPSEISMLSFLEGELIQVFAHDPAKNFRSVPQIAEDH